MVRDHRGHTCSEATQNPCKFLSTHGQSKNPEIQYFQMLPHKNFNFTNCTSLKSGVFFLLPEDVHLYFCLTI